MEGLYGLLQGPQGRSRAGAPLTRQQGIIMDSLFAMPPDRAETSVPIDLYPYPHEPWRPLTDDVDDWLANAGLEEVGKKVTFVHPAQYRVTHELRPVWDYPYWRRTYEFADPHQAMLFKLRFS